MLVDRERRADKKSRSVRRGAKNQASRDVITHYGSAPDHTRPATVDLVGNHISPRGAKVHGVGESHANNMEKWQHGRLLRHLGGSCGLRARLLRFLDGPKQQRSATLTCWPALGQQ